ncbi:lysophospholipid acyltransferase family protein [Cognatishimia sp. F0-27]|uniref:lysophospholipid acyltransferase family protein n=1 Tax=Cognatishimia sp. F0-27 TaxID=2816855 RepID=UPI001D0C4E66|nr:lysophospholipid acyltransferase family protein [Cognatishimia sp. F0-27]MCC1491586.1 lysophospholipid acyltransferase family protein [Cognatishimia sp. F0-27]
MTDSIRSRIDPLIADRAPWLFADRVGTGMLRTGLHRMLRYDDTLRLGEALSALPSAALMDRLGRLLARELTVSGLDHVPRHGPALVVANHPTGIADGIVLNHVLSRVRQDAYFFANHDILRVMPQMTDMIAPVEWREDRRSHAKTRETMLYTRRAVAAGRLGVIFPSGRLAKRRGLRLHERPWMASAAMIARKFDLPVVPVNIRARNSALFYIFDLIHPTLRDITLFHETLNKARQPFEITVGEPISAAALPDRSEDGIAMLRRATLALGGATHAATVSLIDSSLRPGRA